jgi:hypothetical protein
VDGGDVDRIFNQAGTYTLRARARASGGTGTYLSPWIERPLNLQTVDAELLAVYEDPDNSGNYVNITTDLSLLNRDLTRFRILAADRNDPGYNGSADLLTNDGVGISRVAYELRYPSGELFIPGSDDELDYCVFGGNGPCNEITASLFADMTPGTWTLRMRAQVGILWSDWQETQFTVPGQDIFIGLKSPVGASNPITLRSQTALEVIVYDPTQVTNPPAEDAPIADHEPFNGTGVQRVQIDINAPRNINFDINADGRSNEGGLIYDTDTLYCIFSGSGSCDTMDDDEFARYLAVGGTYTLRVRAEVDGADRWTEWSSFTWDLPPYYSCDNLEEATSAPWAANEIGGAQTARSQTDGTTVFVCGEGNTMFNGSDNDEFRFVSQEVDLSATPSVTLTARVNFFDGDDNGQMAGVMFRNDRVNSGAAGAGMLLRSDGTIDAGSLRFRYRANNDNNASDNTIGNRSVPTWVRVVRDGNTVSGYSSADGINWTLQSSQTVNFTNSTLYAGLGVSADGGGDFARAIFSNVQIVTGP